MRKFKFLPKIAVVLLVAAVTLYSCSKEESIIKPAAKTSLISTAQENAPAMSNGRVNPDNPANPFDFAGQYVAAAFEYANGTADVNEYNASLGEYVNANPLEMYALQAPMNAAEQKFLADYAADFEKANNTNERIITSKRFEANAVSDRTFTPAQKERILYLVSIIKHATAFSETTGTSIEMGDAFFEIIELLGINNIDTGDGGPSVE